MSLEQPSQDHRSQPSPSSPTHKRPVSERRIQANRRNALRSTGPKTERGKRTVSRNPIKHGLLAREVVITAGDGKESAAEFHTLLGRFCDCYKPVGVVEESLVQTIAACWWRKARVIRAENGEIRKRLDTLAVDRAFRSSDQANLDLLLSEMELDVYRPDNQADQQVSTRKRWSAIQDGQTTLREHPAGLAYLSALLKTAKSEMARDGYLSEKIRKRIVLAFGFWDCLFALTCANAGPLEARKEDPILEDAVDRQTDERRAAVAAFIDHRLETITVLQGYAKERENLTLDAKGRSFKLPPAEATDKLLRYEAHLDRQLYRAMDELERLQRRRRGESVPPPINVNLGRRR
jgi:hypothetical protein